MGIVLFVLCFFYCCSCPFLCLCCLRFIASFFFFFMVLVVTFVGAWLKRKHPKTRLRREKFVDLCFCVSVYDLTRVFMGLIFWV